jgi:hypothetical protein
MPVLSLYFIRTALLYLLCGTTIGAVLLIQKGIPFLKPFWILLPVHIEMVIFGWIIQLVMGVAFWMLPRYGVAPVRGNQIWMVLAYIFLNAGVILVCAGSLLYIYPAIRVAGHVLEGLAVIFFARQIWPRIKSFGSK